MSKRVAIVGPGTMGRVLAQALQADNPTLISRDGFAQTDWANFDVVCFAIKPQDFKNLTPLPLAGKFILSVMAGISTETLQRMTGSDQIVRCMPNTPMQIGMGMTVWCKTHSVDPQTVDWLIQRLTTVTKLLLVNNDDWVDKATAISASGPGFLFTMVEQYIGAAQQLGFSKEQAELLVTQTYLGSAELLKHSTRSAQELAANVTSKGGTTAAGLAVLQKNNIWLDVLAAAYKRAKELSR